MMKPRNWIKTTSVGLLLVLLASLSGFRPGHAQTATPTPERTAPPAGATERTITVTATGAAAAMPDEAIMTLGVQTEAEAASEALAQNNDQMQALLDTLTAQGVAQADIQTQYVSLSPRYSNEPQPAGAAEVVGYVASNSVEVHARDLDQLGDLLDAAVAAGGNTISGIRFTVSDSAALRQEARAAAMNEARATAQQLAALAGATLGQVIRITEGSAQSGPVARNIASGSSVPIEPGTEAVNVTIQVTWELNG